MLLGAELGNEMMFICFLPFIFWNLHWQLGRYVVYAWFFSEYVGQVIKDIFCLPRPLSPPVIRLEYHYVTEYGLPSTHAMVAVCMSNTLLTALIDHVKDFPFVVGFCAVVVWCLLTCLSRLYLGVHSVIDVYSGLVLGFVCLLLLKYFGITIENYVMQHDNYYVPFAVLAGFVFLLLIYPRNRKVWSSSFGDTARVLGVVCGSLLSDWMHTDLVATSASPFIEPKSNVMIEFTLSLIVLKTLLLRCLIGYPVIILCKIIGKKLMYAIVPHIVEKMGLGKSYIENVNNCNRYIIEVPSVFITYTLTGFSAVYIAPYIMKFLGIPV